MVTDRRGSPRSGEAKPRLVIVWLVLCPSDAGLGFDEHINSIFDNVKYY